MRGCKRAIERGERGVRVKMGKGLQPQNGEKIKVRVFWGFRVFWVHECFFCPLFLLSPTLFTEFFLAKILKATLNLLTFFILVLGF